MLYEQYYDIFLGTCACANDDHQDALTRNVSQERDGFHQLEAELICYLFFKHLHVLLIEADLFIKILYHTPTATDIPFKLIG